MVEKREAKVSSAYAHAGGNLYLEISLAYETLFAQEVVNSELFSGNFRGQLLEL